MDMTRAFPPNLLRRFRLFVLLPLLAACTADIRAESDIEFGPSSATAIVVVGTSTNRAQVHSWSGQSLSTFWQEYDPAARQLVRDGRSFRTKVLRGPLISTDYETPTVTVHEVVPGDYALTAAGFPHIMTLFVPRVFDGRNPGYVVDPRRHIAPEAQVDPRTNFVFSVDPGEIVYIGHFNFTKDLVLDQLVGIDYDLHPEAARAALADFPGIRGDLRVLDLRNQTESAQLSP